MSGALGLPCEHDRIRGQRRGIGLVLLNVCVKPLLWYASDRLKRLRFRFEQRHSDDVQHLRVTSVLVLTLVFGHFLRRAIAHRSNPGPRSGRRPFLPGDTTP